MKLKRQKLSGECDLCGNHTLECRCIRQTEFQPKRIEDNRPINLFNPYDTENVDQLQEIGFYWLQRSDRYRRTIDAYIEILQDNGIEVSLDELLKKINSITVREASCCPACRNENVACVCMSVDDKLKDMPLPPEIVAYYDKKLGIDSKPYRVIGPLKGDIFQ